MTGGDAAPEERDHGRWAAAAGWAALVALALGSLLLVGTTERSATGEVVTTHDEAARRFLVSWDRYRTGDFVLTGTFTRTTPDGGDLVSEYVLAQRPPERTVFQFGALERTVDGIPLVCEHDPDGTEHCVDGEAGATYDEAVADEAAALLGYFFATDPPLYEVIVDEDGCYQLLLRRQMDLPPYGFATTFCFDDATGALVELVQQRPGAVDHLVVRDVRTDVTDGDLAPVLATES